MAPYVSNDTISVPAFPNRKSSNTSFSAPNPIAPYATQPNSARLQCDPAYPVPSASAHVTIVRTIDNRDALNPLTPALAIAPTSAAANANPTTAAGTTHSARAFHSLPDAREPTT